jgi:hypothetical protein
MADGTDQVIIGFDGAAIPPVYTVTVRWDEPTPDNIPPSYVLTIPVNPF